MSIIDWGSGAAILLGAVFFCAGTVGLLRFPDVYTRLHALTKADNVGLAFIVLGLAGQAESGSEIAKLVLVWGLVMLSSTTCCHLVAQSVTRAQVTPWTRSDGPVRRDNGSGWDE